MEFGIEKCAVFVLENGKIEKSVGIELLDSKQSYQVVTQRWKLQIFRNFRSNKFLQEKMKLNASKE